MTQKKKKKNWQNSHDSKIEFHVHKSISLTGIGQQGRSTKIASSSTLSFSEKKILAYLNIDNGIIIVGIKVEILGTIWNLY
jgi:hypothetical protein